MKKLFSAIILCTAILCGCSEKGENGISETDIPETSSVTVAVESTAATSAKTETTTTITTKTTAEETAEEEIILTPIPSNEPLEVMACKIIEDTAIDNEEDFPDKEVIKRAREICFADEEVKENIKLYNDSIDNGNYIPEYEYFFKKGVYSCDYEDVKIENDEDIFFSCGMAFDFDGDGSDEYVIALDYLPLSPMDGGFLILMDGSEYEIFARHYSDIKGHNMEIISSENYYFPMVTLYAGQWYSMDIYSFENNKPKDVLDYHREAHSIGYENGIFCLEVKYTYTIYPFVLCEDGVFRQFGREKITREDFENHVQNGGKYLDSLAEKGDEVTNIYTYGYCNYELCGEDFHYDVYNSFYRDDKDIFLTKRSDYTLDEFNFFGFTDEFVYGDIWAVKPV